MTDKEIIKALECANAEKPCFVCTQWDIVENVCNGLEIADVLALIKRQKAEIERLECSADLWKEDAKHYFNELQTAKAEAIKEFAERLKNKLTACSKNIDGECEYLICDYDIDNLVKEMLAKKCENQDENLRKNVKVIGEQQ